MKADINLMGKRRGIKQDKKGTISREPKRQAEVGKLKKGVFRGQVGK